MALTMQEQIELLTPLFEPVVKDIQEIKENTEATKEQTELMNTQLEEVKEAADTPAPAAETDSTEVQSISVQSAETVPEEESEAVPLDPVEAVETEPQEDYMQLTYETLQETNTLLAEISEQQAAQQEVMQDGFMMVLLTIVIALGIKTFVEQVTKW